MKIISLYTQTLTYQMASVFYFTTILIKPAKVFRYELP